MPGPANEQGRKKRQNRKQKTKKIAPATLPPSPLSIAATATGTDAKHQPAQSPPENASHAADPPSRRVNSARKYRETEGGYERGEYVASGEERRRDGAYAHGEPTRSSHGAAANGASYEENRGYKEEDGEEEDGDVDPEVEHLESSASYIYDPGNGPRVRDFLAFLKSPFAAPQSQSFLVIGRDDDGGHTRTVEELAAAGDEGYPAVSVIPILNRFLPGEFATILWFNRTRRTQRICPACQRLYHLGDDLQPLIARAEGLAAQDADPATRKMEQYLSGICSFTCFALATYNYGPAAVWAYALPLHELDEDTRDVIEGEGSGVDDQGLSTYVRMTRYDGEGLMALLSGAV